jgi:hypothetical protein
MVGGGRVATGLRASEAAAASVRRPSRNAAAALADRHRTPIRLIRQVFDFSSKLSSLRALIHGHPAGRRIR